MHIIYCQGSTNMDILLKGRQKLRRSDAFLIQRDLSAAKLKTEKLSVMCTV